MNPYLWCAAAIAAYIAASTTLARLGYGVRVYIAIRRPHRNPRLPTPKPGNVVMPLQVSREFEGLLREGLVGIVKMESVGDGTVTLTLQQTQPQGK